MHAVYAGKQILNLSFLQVCNDVKKKKIKSNDQSWSLICESVQG